MPGSKDRPEGWGRLGARLIERGCVTEAQLTLALKEQQRTRRRLGEILVALGFTTDQEITTSLASQAGVESVDLASMELGPEVAGILDVEFCRHHALVPIAVDDKVVRVAMANAFDILTVDTVGRVTGKRVDVVAAPERDIAAAIGRLSGGSNAGALEPLIAEAQRAVDTQAESRASVGKRPVVTLVDALLEDAVRRNATDLHVEPEVRIVRTRLRVDGVLVQGPTLPKAIQGAVTARLKLMASLDISESRAPQDGKINIEIDRREIGIRVSTLPTIHGENVVMRLLDKSKVVVGLEDLGYSTLNLDAFGAAIRRPAGIILVTGPTGSGKTTTLYAALNAINATELKIATLEDPVEYEMPVIRQSQVNVAAGLGFGQGLRALLRQDPDVILVGEMRDAETVEVALRAAMTGHLVLSTLHTSSAAGAIPRLRNMNIEPYLLSSTLVAVLAQRLVRKLCTHCRRADESPDAIECESLGLEAGSFEGLAPVGCSRCGGTGYRGRRAIAEVLAVTPEVGRAIARGGGVEELVAVATAGGMVTMVEEARAMVTSGETSVHEALRHTWDAGGSHDTGDGAGEPMREAA